MFLVQAAAALLVAALLPACAVGGDIPSQAGSALFFDGVDDFSMGLTSFDLLSNWTVEAWVDPSSDATSEVSTKCILHVTTYSAANVLSITYDSSQWKVTYGSTELVADKPSDSVSEAPASWSPRDYQKSSSQQHLAVTHLIDVSNSTHSSLRFFLDGVVVAEEMVALPSLSEPVLPPLLATCNTLTRQGFVRTNHFRGYLDEVRLWSLARSSEEVAAAMNFTGPSSDWPAAAQPAVIGGVSSSLVVQYSFDDRSDGELTDSSGNDVVGLMAGGGFSQEYPTYRRSPFGQLGVGPRFYVALTASEATMAEGAATCPSPNCLDLSALLSEPIDGVSYASLRVLALPSTANVTLRSFGNLTALAVGDHFSTGQLEFLSASSIALDTFRLALCTADTSGCTESETFAVTVETDKAPTAGLSNSLKFFGDAGYLELSEALPASGTVEFWVQLEHLSGDQTLFSVSRQASAADDDWNLDVPAFALSASDDVLSISMCNHPVNKEEESFEWSIPELSTTEPQHITVSWQYVRATRGRGVYNLWVYQNCQLIVGPLTIEDACVTFGYTDDELHYPTFGQQYRLSPVGLLPDNFADTSFGDLRVWSAVRTASEICGGMASLLDAASESTLQSYFPMGPEDASRNDGMLENKGASGLSAHLQCSNTRLSCPSASMQRGYVLEANRFPLPAQPVTLITSAGVVSPGAGSSLLPSLSIPTPSFDRDASSAYASDLSGVEETFVMITGLPDSSCGSLYFADETELVSAGATLQDTSKLPLVFKPTAASCSTKVTYAAVNVQQVNSTFEATVNIVVKIPGPTIAAFNAIQQGSSDDGPSVGDLLAITFDQPISHRSDWRGLFEAVDGSLGKTNFSMSWSDDSTILYLEILGPVETYYEVISTGTCSEHGLLSIGSASACSLAAAALSLPTTTATTESSLTSPEGCYLFDETTVTFNSAAGAAGNGAETSTMGLPRQPICYFPAVELTPGTSKLKFTANFTDAMTILSTDTYPVADLSPVLADSLSERYCPNGTLFWTTNFSCVECLPGTYLSPNGLECTACPAGTVAPNNQSSECEACEIGKFLDPDSAQREVCQDAPVGQYVDTTGATIAFDCPTGTVGERTGSSSCERCPEGANCETVRFPRARIFAVPEAEYYRTPEGKIMECALPRACLGWDTDLSENVCAEGMAGHLCQACIGGYWRPNDRTKALCEPCEFKQGWWFASTTAAETLIIWIIAVLSVDAACWGNMHAVILRLGLNYFSIVNVLSHVEQWEWEKALGISADTSDGVKYVASYAEGLLRFDGGVTAYLMGFECWLGKDGIWDEMKTTTWIWTLLPIAWPVALLALSVLLFEVYTWYRRIAWRLRNMPFRPETYWNAENAQDEIFVRERRLFGLLRKRAARCNICDRWRLVLKDAFPLVIICQFLLLPTIIRQLVVVLSCDKLGGSETRLFVAPEVHCWVGEHLDLSAVALTGIVIWGVVFPILTSCYLYGIRTANGQAFNDLRFKAKWGFLADGYEPRWVFWELFVYGRKLLIAAVALFPDMTRASELAVYQVVGVGAMLLHYLVKPFDNRNGELLDRIELYGLCFFLLLVTFMQVVLLADIDSQYELLPVLLVCSILGVGSVIMETHTSTLRFYASFSVTGFFAVLAIIYCVVDGVESRRRTALLILGFALLLNTGFIIWLVVKVLRQMLEALGELLQRLRVLENQQFLQAASKDAVQLALQARHMLTESVPYGSLFAKPVMPKKPSNTVFAKLQRAIMHANFDSSGAKLWFDVETRELVLGLHPDNFVDDPRISNHLRRRLVASGPFLTDEERRFIAMSLRDALLHLVVDCDQNVVHCAILELLVRSAFVWYNRQEREATFGTNQKRADFEEEFVEECFDEATFRRSMSAADFQAQLGKMTRMPPEQIDALVKTFLRVHNDLNDEFMAKGKLLEPLDNLAEKRKKKRQTKEDEGDPNLLQLKDAAAAVVTANSPVSPGGGSAGVGLGGVGPSSAAAAAAAPAAT